MIPKEEYITSNQTPCVDADLIRKYHTEDQAANFFEWHSGQTGTMGEDGKHLIYSWDYERWVEQGMKTGQEEWDWD